MAISFIASNQATGVNPAISFSGFGTLTEGDLFVLVTTGGTLTTPDGWTRIYTQGAGRNLTICTRYVPAQTLGISDFLTLTLTGTDSRARVLCYRGAGNYNAIATVATGTGTTATTNSQTTTYANTYVLSIYSANSGTASTFTAPASTTTRGNNASTASIDGLLIVDELKAAAGATATRAATLSASVAWAAVSVSFVETRTNVYWVGGAGTWSISATGNWSNSSGGSTTGVVPPGGNENAVIDTSSGTGTITCTDGLCKDLTVTASQAIILGAASSTLSVLGNISFPAGGSFSASSNANTISFRPTSNKSITTNGKSVSSLTLTSAFETVTGYTYTLVDALTATGTVTLTDGTLDLGTNSSNLTCASFQSNSGSVRAITFGSASITTTGSGAAWLTSTVVNYSFTGTPTVNISNSGGTATTVSVTGGATNAFNFNFTTGTYALTLTATDFRNLDFTGFAGSWSPGSAAYNIPGNLTLSSGMTYTAGTSVWTFNGTGTQVLTTNGKSLYAITQNQTTSGSVRLASGTTTLTNNYTLTDGDLDLGTNTATLQCRAFSSNNSNSRRILFGTGTINVTGDSTTVIDFTAMNNFSFTGTSNFRCTYSGALGTRTISLSPFNDGGSGGTEGRSMNISITAGSDTILPRDGSIFRNWNWTGYTGTFTHNAFDYTLYGDFTIPAAMNWNNTGGGRLIFDATSGTQTITTNGETLSAITMSGVGGTRILGSDLTVNSARTLTLTAGIFNASNYNVTTGLFSSSNSNARTITMGSGTWTLSGTGTVWNLATTTGLSFNRDTANIVLSNTTTSSRTFAGGGLTYNNLTIGGATGTSTLIITGSNTFATLASTKTVAHTITLPASGTTTCSDWTITGTAGNVVTLNSSTSGTQSTLTKTGGNTITGINYLSIRDSNATPSDTWYAGYNSTNVSNNTGWFFTSGPGANGNMFLMFM
jgi:hypothetical protein